MTLRVIDTGLRPARWNAAASAALCRLHAEGRIPDTLRFHCYERSVLLGRMQIASDAVDIDACHARGVAIARRTTGGGAVYMAPGIFVWEVLLRRDRFASLDAAAAAILQSIVRALCALGVGATFTPPNAIAVTERKISGASGAFEGGTLVMHGTVIADVDWVEFGDVLRVPGGALHCVTSLRDCGVDIPIGRLRDAIASELSRLLEAEATTGAMTSAEIVLTEAMLNDEIGTDAFVLGENGRLLQSEVA